jgi:RNA polymerase sigma factor (sigma-70 family)
MTAGRNFEDFWARERDPIRIALGMTLGDAHLAADAVDEAMARAFSRWRRISRYEDPAGWVFHVAMNWARSALRKRRLRPTLDSAVLEGVAEGDHDVVPDGELWASVAALPLPQRSVVVLRFYLDWPLERIATATGVPSGTVKSRLHRALATLEAQQEVRA